MNVFFLFHHDINGINDGIKIPKITGTLIDAQCAFTKDLVWFFYTVEEKGKIFNYCNVIKSNGNLIASANEEKDSDSWLGNIRGKLAIGNFIFSANDEGIVRSEIIGDKIEETKKFPDAEPFVNSNSRLYQGSGGILAVNSNRIILLNMK
jgi:hypothetical protein